jgi:protease IV
MMNESSNKKEGWEREVLERLAFASLQEQRTKRRWSIFFRFLAFGYLALLFVAFGDVGGAGAHTGERHTALIDLNGVIEVGGDASAESLLASLHDAFEEQHAVGVVLRVNSPGGSPVQSSIIHDEIKRLRTKHPEKALHVVVEDVCASGGYFVASAADKIFVNRASVVGSIGVLMDGFGFTGSMDKLGIERRLLTAGENKGFLDPFSPKDERQRKHAQTLLNDIHQQFIQVVRSGRGKRLKESSDMFSGLMWTGQQSVALGLADDFGTVDSVARDIFKAEKVIDYTMHRSLTDRIAKRFGSAMGDSLVAAVRGLRLY